MNLYNFSRVVSGSSFAQKDPERFTTRFASNAVRPLPGHYTSQTRYLPPCARNTLRVFRPMRHQFPNHLIPDKLRRLNRTAKRRILL
jgi:hypothetical protein